MIKRILFAISFIIGIVFLALLVTFVSVKLLICLILGYQFGSFMYDVWKVIN